MDESSRHHHRPITGADGAARPSPYFAHAADPLRFAQDELVARVGELLWEFRADRSAYVKGRLEQALEDFGLLIAVDD